MKKLILIVLMLLISIDGAFAFDFDNRAYFEETEDSYGKIHIKNGFGWFNQTLAVFELTNNSDYCEKDCWAEGTATFYEEDMLFRSIKFKDKGDGIKDKTKYKAKFYLWDGSKWDKYNNDVLPVGTYQWRLEGKKDKAESIDWIGNAFGIDLDLWAWWNATYNKRIEFQINASNTENIYNYPLHLPFNCVADCSDDGQEIVLLVNDTDIIENVNITKIASQQFNLTFRWNLTANTNLTIYGYFNNATEVTTYSTDYISAYYEYYEDFDTDVFADGDWNTTDPSDAYVNLTEKVLKMWDSNADNAFTQPNHTRYPFLDILDNESISNLKIRVNYSQAGGDSISVPYIVYNRTSVYNTAYLQLFAQYDTGASNKWYNTSAYTEITTNAPVINVYQTWEFNLYNTTYSGFEVDANELFLYNHPAALPQTQIGMIQFYEGNVGATPRFDVDYVHVYKTGLVPVISSSAPELQAQNKSVSSQSLTPATVYTNDTLACSFIALDSNVAKSMIGVISWYNSTELMSQVNETGVTNGTAVSKQLASSETTRDETWTCGMQLYEASEGFGTQINLSKTIQDTIPSVPSYMFPSDNFISTGNTTITCAGSTDIDNDIVQYEIYGDNVNPPTTLLKNATNGTYAWDTLVTGNNFWRCRAYAGGQVSPYTNIRTIISTNISVCSGSGDEALTLNFTHKVENNETIVTADFESTFELWGDDRTQRSELNVVAAGTENVSICIYPANASFNADATIQYVKAGFDVREHYLIEANLTNITQNINLYLLEIALASPITFEVTDDNDNPLQDHYIYVQRYDVGTNTYRTVAMGQTDNFGEETIFLRKQDAFYRFIVQDGTDVVFTSSKLKIVDDTIFIKVQPSLFSDLINKYGSVSYTHSYDDTTNTFSVTFTDTSGGISKGCLHVTKQKRAERNTICDRCLSTTSGTLSCTTDNDTAVYTSTFYVEGSPEFPKDVLNEDLTVKIASSLGSGTGGFLMLIFFIAMVSLFAFNSLLAIAMGVLAFGMFATLGIFPLLPSTFMFIIAIVIGVWFSRKKNG